MTEQRVYFAVSGRRIKVGLSGNVDLRLKQVGEHLIASPVLIGSFPGNYETERRVHERLTRFRLNGEWYRDCLEMRALIDIFIRRGASFFGVDLPLLIPQPGLASTEQLSELMLQLGGCGRKKRLKTCRLVPARAFAVAIDGWPAIRAFRGIAPWRFKASWRLLMCSAAASSSSSISISESAQPAKPVRHDRDGGVSHGDRIEPCWPSRRIRQAGCELRHFKFSVLNAGGARLGRASGKCLGPAPLTVWLTARHFASRRGEPHKFTVRLRPTDPAKPSTCRLSRFARASAEAFNAGRAA